MSNESEQIPEDILQTLYEHPFQALQGQTEPLDKLVEKIKQQRINGAPPAKTGIRIEYQGIAEEISQVVFDYLLKRPEDQEGVYKLIQPKVKDPADKQKNLPLQAYLVKSKPENLLHGKTVQRFMHSGKASKGIIKVLKAFCLVVASEREERGRLQHVEGNYNLYNLDSVEQQRFQVSNFMLQSIGHSTLVYFSHRGREEKQKVRLEMVGHNKLLIHLVMDDCRMFFYMNVGSQAVPAILQPVFLYDNQHGQPVASIAVLCRADHSSAGHKEPRLRKPERNLPSTGDIVIDRYLKHRAAMLTARSGQNRFQQFDKSDLSVEPGPFRRDARHYESLRERKGLYRIYFCERYPSARPLPSNRYFSTVGQGYLHIYEDPFGRLRASMKTRLDSNGKPLLHEGWVINDLLQDGNYMILKLYREPGRGRAVSLFLLLSNSKVMFGSHNIMYEFLRELGSGAIVLQRELAEGDGISAAEIKRAFAKRQPAALSPTSTELEPYEQRIVNYLSALSSSLVSPVTDHGHLKRQFPPAVHAGTYKMYSYGKGGIRMGILRIYPTGFVTHKSIGGDQEEIIHAYGKAQLVRQSLYLQLENRDNGRLGFCVFKSEGEVPPSADKTIFTGTFCGVTRRNGEFPLASRLVLEFVSEKPEQAGQEPLYVKYDEEAFDKIPKAVQQALKGRAESMIGFFKNKSNILDYEGLNRFNEQEADLRSALVQAAVYIRSGSSEKEAAEEIEQLLEKAEKYGERRARSQYVKLLRQAVTPLYERAAYYLVIKQDKKTCIRLLRQARSLNGQPLDLLSFEKEIGERQELFELKKIAAYRRLWKE